MLLDTKPSLGDVIVQMVAAQGTLKASDIRTEVAKRRKPYTMQAIYQELRKLDRRGVIVRSAGWYGLSLAWALDITRLGERVREAYLAPAVIEEFLPGPGESRRWAFTSLDRLDNFWINAMLALYRHGRRNMFCWLPHPWFHFLNHAKELKFQDTLRTMGRRLYLIVGGRSYLDRHFRKFWSPDVYVHSLSVGPFEGQRSRYFNVIGDYVLGIELSPATAAGIDLLFENVRSPADINIGLIHETMHARTNIRVKLHHSRTKALRLKRAFCDFFGTRVEDF